MKKKTFRCLTRLGHVHTSIESRSSFHVGMNTISSPEGSLFAGHAITIAVKMPRITWFSHVDGRGTGSPRGRTVLVIHV